jgi:hypothetical protein
MKHSPLRRLAFTTVHAALLAGLAMLPGSAGAVAIDPVVIDAETFFADCTNPIFVTEDTTLTGKAEIDASCRVSVVGGVTLNLSKVKLTFTGEFYVSGDAALVFVDRSKIAAANLILDAEDAMTIDRSTLTATGGNINLPPGFGADITKSKLFASQDVAFGGPNGGFRSSKRRSRPALC